MSSPRNKKRTYLRKIYQWMVLAILLPLLLFASIAFVNVEKTVLHNEYESNQKILYEIKYNISLMDDMILNAIISMYYNPEISPIILNPNVDFTDVLNEMNKIKTTNIGANPFIQSIYLYNSHTNDYYTTLDNLFFQDKNFEELLHSKQALPKLMPVPRKIEYPIDNNKIRAENVISYFMYDFKNADNQPEGALVFNASTEWLLNNIKEINMADGVQQNDKIIVLDNQGEIVRNNMEVDSLQNAIKTAYQGHKPTKDGTGYFTDDINGRKYLITYAYIDKMNWTLVKAQLYSSVFEKISTLKYTLVAIILAIILLAFIGSIYISRKIYQPIGNLLKNVESHAADIDPSDIYMKDEMVYLSRAYQLSFEQLNEYKRSKHSDREILKSYFLRKLLVDSRSVSGEYYAKMVSELGIWIKQDAPLLVCVVKIDGRVQFEQSYTAFDRDLYIYGIINISSEILSASYPVEVVEMKNDHIAFILNMDEPFADSRRARLIECWKQAQAVIDQFYAMSISVFIGDPCEGLHALTNSYRAVLNNSEYRLLFGKSCILTNAMIQANANNRQSGYSAMFEKKFLEAMKSGNGQAMEDMLAKLFHEIAALSYSNVFLSIMGLVNALKQVTEEINRVKLEPLPDNFNSLSHQLFGMETLTEQHEAVLHYCRNLMAKAMRTENEKHVIITDTVVELVQADYANPELCLPYIAEKLNLSAKHLSKLFNQQYGRSIGDYINEVRLEKAAEWFRTSNRSVKEVLQKIGVANETYFYRLFKKKYGVTPKAYILNKHVQDTRQSD